MQTESYSKKARMLAKNYGFEDQLTRLESL
jgi:hypothetical protein